MPKKSAILATIVAKSARILAGVDLGMSGATVVYYWYIER